MRNVSVVNDAPIRYSLGLLDSYAVLNDQEAR